ncbi:MAG TPA: alpha/beta hydrolase-fold protein [Bauldia sp.]|nr:alpha/beta hydrolase-fold protein [Bauldia sp.]
MTRKPRIRSGWQPLAETSGRRSFRHESPALGDTLRVTVVPPAGQTPRGGEPVIVVLDAFLTLDTVAGWAGVYGRYAGGAVPPAWVVGIGHDTDDEGDFLARRIRDLTPTPVTGREWRPPLGAGNAGRLLDAIAGEIIPFVEGEFGAGGDRTLIGWSLGGLFALDSLFHRPGLFGRYLIVSPSLWWEERLPFRWEREWADGHDDLDARVFMAVGAEEEAPGGGWLSEDFADEVIAWFRQVTNFRAFTRRLKARRYPGLRLDTAVFPDEYHMTVYPAAVARGLVRLFAP